MSCNFAVSITKAEVLAGALVGLLETPQLEAMVRAYLEGKGIAARVWVQPGYAGHVRPVGDVVWATFGPNEIAVRDGRVQVRSTRLDRTAGFAEAQALAADLEALMTQAAEAAFAQKVAATLAQLGIVEAAPVEVAEAGQRRLATLLTVRL